MANQQQISLPADEASVPDRLPVLALTDAVVFPHVLAPMAVTEGAVAARVLDADHSHKQLALVALRPGRTPQESDADNPPFFDIGTLGHILQLVKLPDSTVRMLVQARSRLRLRDFSFDDGAWTARAEPLQQEDTSGARVEAMQRAVLDMFRQIASASPQVSEEEVQQILAGVQDAAQLADFVSANLSLELEQKQALLEEANVARRLERLVELLGEERKVLEYGSQLQEKLKEDLSKTQREVWLREQLKVIQDELGEGEAGASEELREQIEAAQMPEPAREQAERELRRLERTVPQAAEYQVIRNYLEWLIELPWAKESEEGIDLARAREVLDRDHYDLDEIKERIVEYLAVRKLNPELRGPILCFVGPPGVGKTSLGHSIAEAIGREFTRMSLGGVRDEAEIRGHRRTYVGALPGRIIQGIRQAGVRNPVFMLDEIDKVGQDFRGDPTAALLEALDPAQNGNFSDHYLELSFDLSHVLFITTANTLAPVPPALQDRLEVLELPGYTENEKLEIARRFLLPRQRETGGLEEPQVRVSDNALRRLIDEYTREAGVRELERQIGRIMRKVALRLVERGEGGQVRVNRRNLADFLGKRRFEKEVAGRADEVGTTTALAYTPAGGQILFIEVVRMPGEGEIHLTGQLGEIMRESAQTALSYVRSHASALGLGVSDDDFQKSDVHVHIPAGATPKDGPSAGVALVVALASLFSGRAVRREVAMTGEITLRGHVLPVGGIKEKLIAGSHAGIRSVLLPRRSEADLDEVPEDVREQVEFILIDDAADAVRHALGELADTAGTDGSTARSAAAGD